jgi:hypothetical protein
MGVRTVSPRGIFPHLGSAARNIPFVSPENSAFTIVEQLLLPALLARLTGTSLASAVYWDDRGTTSGQELPCHLK